MAGRGRLIASVGVRALLAAAVLLAARPARAVASGTGTIALTAEAGLGGVCKPGRWMPVRVWLATGGEDVAGEIVVQWGNATLHRDVALASPSRARYDLYIQTFEVRGTLTVRLRSHGVDLQSVEVPVHAARPDDTVTLCVAAGDGGWAGQAECTSTVPPDALPQSMRGYDAADRVTWQPGTPALLGAAQRTAFDQWQSYRQLEEAGLLSRSPSQPAAITGLPRSRRSRDAAAAGIGVYLVILLGLGAWGRRPRRLPLAVYAAIALAAGLGASAILAAGRFGPGSAVAVRHASTIRQLTGGGSFISMRGVAEYPAFGAFTLRAGVADLAAPAAPNRASEQWSDAGGYPQIPGVFGLGARQAFAFEGVVEFAPLDIERRADVVRVTNRSGVELGGCRFPDGFSVRDIGAMRPGQSVEGRELRAGDEPLFACTLAVSPVEFWDGDRPARTAGTSVLTVRLGPRDGARPESP